MSKRILLLLSMALCFKQAIIPNASATVFVTHGLGINGIKYYQESTYIDLIKKSAKILGHETICIPWLDQNNPEKEYAGILPQERIIGAAKIAKEILSEIKAGNQIILVGHGYGGQVMACATRLLNPENKTLTDSFIYELIYLIKNFGKESFGDDFEQTRAISPGALINALIVGWQVSKKVLTVIEEAEIINKNLINLVKQNISLKFINETKAAWQDAFAQVQSYKKSLFPNGFDYKNSIKMIYTIGTAHNGDVAFSTDMDVVENHVNFYSSADSVLRISSLFILSKNLTQRHPRSVNIGVLFEPNKGVAPKHAEFCGNVLMAPWILQIPSELKSKNLGGFERFQWGKNGLITFYAEMIPAFKSMDNLG